VLSKFQKLVAFMLVSECFGTETDTVALVRPSPLIWSSTSGTLSTVLYCLSTLSLVLTAHATSLLTVQYPSSPVGGESQQSRTDYLPQDSNNITVLYRPKG